MKLRAEKAFGEAPSQESTFQMLRANLNLIKKHSRGEKIVIPPNLIPVVLAFVRGQSPLNGVISKFPGLKAPINFLMGKLKSVEHATVHSRFGVMPEGPDELFVNGFNDAFTRSALFLDVFIELSGGKLIDRPRLLKCLASVEQFNSYFVAGHLMNIGFAGLVSCAMYGYSDGAVSIKYDGNKSQISSHRRGRDLIDDIRARNSGLFWP